MSLDFLEDSGKSIQKFWLIPDRSRITNCAKVVVAVVFVRSMNLSSLCDTHTKTMQKCNKNRAKAGENLFDKGR